MLVRNVIRNIKNAVKELPCCEGYVIFEKGYPARYFSSGEEDFIKQEFGNKETYNFRMQENLITGKLRYAIIIYDKEKEQ